MTLTLEVGSAAEDIVDAQLVEPRIIEEPPALRSEPIAEKAVKYFRERTKCEICGQEIASYRMVTHMKFKHPDAAVGYVAPKTAFTKEKAPKAAKSDGPRKKADEILTTAVTVIGGLLVNSKISPPTGMALALEASVLATEFDKAAAGTVIDKMALQPLVRAKSKWEGVGNLAAFPVIVFVLDKNPAMLPVLYPALRSSMKGILPGLVAAKRREVADEKRLQEAAEELAELDLQLETMSSEREFDPIDRLIQSLFASKVTEAPDEPAEPGSAWNGDTGD